MRVFFAKHKNVFEKLFLLNVPFFWKSLASDIIKKLEGIINLFSEEFFQEEGSFIEVFIMGINIYIFHLYTNVQNWKIVSVMFWGTS